MRQHPRPWHEGVANRRCGSVSMKGHRLCLVLLDPSFCGKSVPTSRGPPGNPAEKPLRPMASWGATLGADLPVLVKTSDEAAPVDRQIPTCEKPRPEPCSYSKKLYSNKHLLLQALQLGAGLSYRGYSNGRGSWCSCQQVSLMHSKRWALTVGQHVGFGDRQWDARCGLP